MLRLSWLVRAFIAACLLLISASFACGQIINASADQQVPIPAPDTIIFTCLLRP